MTVLLWFASLIAGLPLLQPAAPSYAQTYVIFIRGALAGTESVSEQLDKNGNRVCSSKHEMLVVDNLETKRLAFETTMVFAKNTAALSSYSYKYLSGSMDSCEVVVKDGKITRTLNRGGNVSESSIDLQPGAILLDVNTYYQYDIFSRVYDFKKRGRQTFNNFIPVIAGYVPVTVTWVDDSSIESGEGRIAVRNFKIEFFGTRTGNFSTDTNGRLVHLVISGQQLEVLRKDLAPTESIK